MTRLLIAARQLHLPLGTLIAVAMLCALVGLPLGLSWLVHNAREAARREFSREGPLNVATGFRFPAFEELSSIRVMQYCGESDFEVRQDRWKEILDALSPSEDFPRVPSMLVLGDLEIRTKRGETIRICMFSLDECATGAFSVHSDDGTRGYYRGGNTRRLKNALERAYAEHLGTAPQTTEGDNQKLPPGIADP